MTTKPITVKQARERGIITSFTSGVTGLRVYQADMCGERLFNTAGEALAAFVAACKLVNRPAE